MPREKKNKQAYTLVNEAIEKNIIDKKTGEVVDCYFTEGSSADSAIDEAEEYAGYDPEDYDFELV